MPFLGEILALTVTVLWTISSLASETPSKRLGSLLLNIVRMVQTILIIGVTLWVVTGKPFPTGTNLGVWGWLALSALAGYIIGDFYFLKCFSMIGARWGELFMTIAPVSAAVTGYFLLGERMSLMAVIGMLITLAGISMSVLSHNSDTPEEKRRLHIKLPIRGIIYGIIAGIGQGVGLVFSKQGMLLYNQVIADDALPLPNLMMPLAATMIRCIVALLGFVIMYTIGLRMGQETHHPRLLLTEHKSLRLATLSTITGPCIGVALSLAASIYTTTGIAQTIMALVPVAILWPSHIFFHTKITVMEVIGAIVSVAGVVLFFL